MKVAIGSRANTGGVIPHHSSLYLSSHLHTSNGIRNQSVAHNFRLKSRSLRQPVRCAASSSSQSDSDGWTPLTPDNPPTLSLGENERVLAKRIVKEQQDRMRNLTPFIVSAPSRGIVGGSRYAKSLRKQIYDASKDRAGKPVVIFGEPGLEKANIAALIHFGSRNGRSPLVKFDCNRLDDDASDLIGGGAKKGLLSYLRQDCTLLLNNVHLAPKATWPVLRNIIECSAKQLSLQTTTIDQSLDAEDSVQQLLEDPSCRILRYPRVIMTSEARVPELEHGVDVIKVPPLRVRPEDIGPLARFYLRKIATDRGYTNVSMTPEAVKRLEAGTYPYNVEELKTAVERALVQTEKVEASGEAIAAPTIIGEEVFWSSSIQPKDRFKMDLFRALPNLRAFARSYLWPEKINFNFTVYAFAFIVILLFVGPQDRQHNFALNAFWDYWWPLIFIAYPFLGRIWCAVCPFMIYGEIVQRLRVMSGAELMKWPRKEMDTWGGWFLFALFAGILVWEEVWDLPNTAYLSSSLLLLITAGAMVGSFFFERRLWCRYLCPIGGMNGMFAKLSMTELRARQGVCSAECDTYSCYKGGPATPPEGMETNGCPVYSHPAQLTDNRNCVLCMECVKACPHRSIEFRWRLPAFDLVSGHTVQVHEVCLMFMLLGAVYLHHLPLLLHDFGLDTSLVAGKVPHIIVSAVVMAIPGLVVWGTDAGWRWLAASTQPAANYVLQPASSASGENSESQQALQILQRASANYEAQVANSPIIAPRKDFIELSYAFLPLVWAGTLAHYIDPFMTEAGTILPVTAATFGMNGSWLPTLTAPQSVVSFCQGICLLGGSAISLILVRMIGAERWANFIPHCVLVALLTAELWHVILP